MNRKPLKIVIITVVLFALVFSLVYAAPARVSAKPVDEKEIKVYAYRIEPLVTMDEERPGFLSEVAKLIVEDPVMDVIVEVSPVAVLMKYSLIQSVGAAAIGLESDFSGAELKDLVGLPLHVMEGKEYMLYFNTINPKGQPLYEAAVKNLEEIKNDGTFEELRKKYNLD